MSRTLAVLLTIAAAVGCSAASATDAQSSEVRSTGEVDLDAAIARVNSEGQALGLRPFTRAEFLAWFEDYQRFELIPAMRAMIAPGLQRGVLSAPFGFETVTFAPALGIAPRIVLNPGNATIIEGDRLTMSTSYNEHVCAEEARLCEEPFAGTLPPAVAASFPASVELRIQEVATPGVCLVPSHCNYDALAIELRLTPANVEDAIAYFGHGFDPTALRARAVRALGNAAESWVRLEALLPGWVGEKASTFPGRDDNEVCHGPARQFFLPEAANGDWDRSTEATAVVLNRFYCRVDDAAQPGFGDYLYVAGRHSGRFILTDPATHRWIVFSVQSGGYAPYRFWWADEDFSGHPFARQPLPEFREKLVDLWRRCR